MFVFLVLFPSVFCSLYAVRCMRACGLQEEKDIGATGRLGREKICRENAGQKIITRIVTLVSYQGRKFITQNQA